MTLGANSCPALSEIKDSFARLRSELPDLKIIADSFENLFLQTAIVKEKLPSSFPEYSEIDPVRFAQGVPILKDWRLEIPLESFLMSADLIVPAMQGCFPKINELLAQVLDYLHNSDLASFQLFPGEKSLSDGTTASLGKEISIEPELLQFITTLITKPFAEKISDSLTPLPDGLNWTKGYCPVCGSWPESSFIRGKEGKRSLRCSFCGHEWGFPRLVCPFCENDDQKKLELFFSEDRSFERAELCHGCKKYVVGLDTRNMISEPVSSVAAIGMIYLDILAQEKGFTPGAICAWNVIETSKGNGAGGNV